VKGGSASDERSQGGSGVGEDDRDPDRTDKGIAIGPDTAGGLQGMYLHMFGMADLLPFM
jgi:hypothetical protein